MVDVRVPHASAGVVVDDNNGDDVQTPATKEFFIWMTQVSEGISEVSASIEDIEDRLTAAGI